MTKLKKIIKGILDSVIYGTSNPLRFQLSSIRKLSEATDEYLLVKLKHEAHLLEKTLRTTIKKIGGRYVKITL